MYEELDRQVKNLIATGLAETGNPAQNYFRANITQRVIPVVIAGLEPDALTVLHLFKVDVKETINSRVVAFTECLRQNGWYPSGVYRIWQLDGSNFGEEMEFKQSRKLSLQQQFSYLNLLQAYTLRYITI